VRRVGRDETRLAIVINGHGQVDLTPIPIPPDPLAGSSQVAFHVQTMEWSVHPEAPS
jgi:hypothetical protein